MSAFKQLWFVKRHSYICANSLETRYNSRSATGKHKQSPEHREGSTYGDCDIWANPIPKVCALKCSLEGDFLYVKTQDRRKEALYPQGRSPWAVAYIPSLPWHQWTSHKSVFIYPPPVLCELLARATLSIGHAPEHESHMRLQGKKDSCHRLPVGNSLLEMSKAWARNLFHFYLTQHFLG